MYAEYSAYYAAPVSTGKYAWAPFPTYTNSGIPTTQTQPESVQQSRRSSRSSSRRNSDPSPVYHLPAHQVMAEAVPLRRSSTRHHDKHVHFVEDQTPPAPLRRSQTERHHRHSTPAAASTTGEGRTFADYYQHYNERERSHHGSRRKRSSRERSRSDPPPASVPVVMPPPPPPPQLHRIHRYGHSHGYPLPPQTHPLQVEVQMNQVPSTSQHRQSSRHTQQTQTAVPLQQQSQQNQQQQHPLYKYVSFAGGSGPTTSAAPASVVVQPEAVPLRRSSRRRSNTDPSSRQVHIAAAPPLAPQSSKITAHAAAPAPVESIFYLGSPQTAPLFVNRTDTRFRKREREPDPEREARRAERRRERAERDAPTGGRDLNREARREERRREREMEKERERADREKQMPQGRGLRRMKAFFFGRY